MDQPAPIWIVDRRPERRTGLARLAGGGDHLVPAAPGDPVLDAGPRPRAVVLGLSGDFEHELAFAQRHLRRLAGARWILVADRGDWDEATRLFDGLDAALLADPPSRESLARELARSARRRSALPLSGRRQAEHLGDRVARWLGGRDHSDQRRALDPRRAGLPLLVRGEPGCGRGLLIRHAHARTHGERGVPLLQLVCGPDTSARQLLEQARSQRAAGPGAQPTVALWLEDVDRLAPEVQRQVRDWVEYGSALLPPVARWSASAGPEREWALGTLLALEPSLARALRGLEVHLPPLRDEPERIEPFVHETLRTWAARMGDSPRRIEDRALALLREHPWPGNLAELEAVLVRSLATSSGPGLGVQHLRFDGEIREPPAPAAPPRDEGPGPGDDGGSAAAGQAPGPAPPRGPAARDAASDSGGPGGEPGEPPPAPTAGPAAPDEPRSAAAAQRQRLARAVAHAIRNPLVPLQTFSALLRERWEDPEFRDDFAAHVGGATHRIAEVVDLLQLVAREPEPSLELVDVPQLLEELLDAHRDETRDHRLLVLKELDRTQPLALAPAEPLRAALQGLLDRAFLDTPPGGDIYVGARYDAGGPLGEPGIVVTLRFAGRGDPESAAARELMASESSLEILAAEILVANLGGHFEVHPGEELRVVLSLPAPATG